MVSLHFTCIRENLAAFFSLHLPSTDHSHYLFLQTSALLRAMRHDQDTKNNDAFILSRCKTIAKINRHEYWSPKIWNSHDIVIKYIAAGSMIKFCVLLFVYLFIYLFLLGLEKALIMSHCLSCSYKVQGTFWFATFW